MMKKRFFCLLLLMSVVLFSLPVFSWASSSETSVIQTIRALGIMNGDESGNLDLSRTITRAEFSKMLISASPYKDTVSSEGSGYSLFRDMKSTHWASEYIKVAVEQGWITGYTDGTFRPDSTITLEEACSAVLRMLGYGADSLAGSFPQAQLSKAASLGLRDGVSAAAGESMTRRDCMYLFYNLLTSETSENQIYGETLGYTVTDGEIDYMAIVRENISGPYISDGSQPDPDFEAAAVYRDGKNASLSDLSLYDVYYYSEILRSVWIYTERVTGEITSLSPDSTSPESVTISGKEYVIGSSEASYRLSALNGTSAGDVVTLLLGMDDSVAGVLTAEEYSVTYYGIVTECEDVVSSGDNAAVHSSVSMACTDGSLRTFEAEQSSSYSTGQMISVTIENGETSMRILPEESVTGTVDSDATRLGNLLFSSEIEILDTSEEGDYAVLKPERLAGRTLSGNDVRYYALNAQGEITHLILDDVSGDTWSYGYLLSADRQSAGNLSFTVTYDYITDGASGTLVSGNTDYLVYARSGFAIRYNSDGSVKSMRNLKSAAVTEIGSSFIRSGNRTFRLYDEVQVYLKDGSNYYSVSLSDINDEDYTITGWYDDFGCSAGNLIRVIIAEEK